MESITEVRAYLLEQRRQLTDQLPALREAIEHAQGNLAANSGAIQMIDHLLARIAQNEEPSP